LGELWSELQDEAISLVRAREWMVVRSAGADTSFSCNGKEKEGAGPYVSMWCGDGDCTLVVAHQQELVGVGWAL